MQLLKRFALFAAAASLACAAHAFQVPGKPVRIIVPLPAGGHADVQMRILARKLGELSGATVLVDNRPGGSTLIGTREMLSAAPDGHTLLATFGIVVMLPHLYRAPPYEFFRDVAPVIQVSQGGLILTAHVSVPAGNIRELIQHARQNPGALSYASTGAGTSSHLNGEMLARLAGLSLVHVPYKGSNDATRDLLAGRVQLFFDATTTALASARTGKAKLIAAATEKRIPSLPDLPTLRESGVDIASDSWLGVFAPRGMARETVDEVQALFTRAIRDPETRALLSTGGAEPTALPAAEFERVLRREHESWGALIRELGIKLD